MPQPRILLCSLVACALATSLRGVSAPQTPGDVSCTGSTTSCCADASIDIDLDYPTLDVTINQATPCGSTPLNFNGTVANDTCVDTPVEVYCECDPDVKKFLNIKPTKDWADVEYCTQMPIRCGEC